MHGLTTKAPCTAIKARFMAPQFPKIAYANVGYIDSIVNLAKTRFAKKD